MNLPQSSDLSLGGEAQVKIGDHAKSIRLPGIDGSHFSSDSLKGRRYMISFFRYASCPFCNLRLHLLVKRQQELGADFGIVAIFDSPLENLRKHTEKHSAPFPILADETGVYYRQFGIRYSWLGVLKGIVTRLPALLKGVFVHGYLPIIIKGRLNTMPADFLVDESGVIRGAYYGADEGDHIPFEEVIAFASGRSG